MEMKKYTFQMTKKEVLELCFRVIWRKQLLALMNGPRLLVAAVLLAVLALQFTTSPIGSLIVIVLVLGTWGAMLMGSYTRIKKGMCKEVWTVWIEEGMLKTETKDGRYNEFSCGSILMVENTPGLLVLGIGLKNGNLQLRSIPLRVFADGQERDAFLESMRNREGKPGEENRVSPPERPEEIPEERSAADPGAEASGEPGQPWGNGFREQRYLSQSYGMGEEEWVRMAADAMEIIQAEPLGKLKKGWLFWIAPAAAFAALTAWVICRLVWRIPNTQWLVYAAFFAGGFFLLMLRHSLEKPEKAMRQQVRQAAVLNTLGDWEIAVTETGIRKSTPGISERDSVAAPWENLLCMVETDTRLFFFEKDNLDFYMLLKEKMEEGEKEALKELCREKRLDILPGKRKSYAPGWLLSVLTVFAVIGFAGALLGMIFGGGDKDAISFEKQISVLRSLGFSISEEMEETWSDYIEENEMTAYVEAYPYTALLMDLSWYDDGEQEGAGVFWFDFEGWDISTDYIRVLEGMQGLAPGSILDGVENIREDIEKVDWEKGEGTIIVSLEWEGQEHSWEMDMENDWIDAKVLGIYNSLLEKEGISERFYYTGDDGQGALVFYCTRDWASEFERATDLKMRSNTAREGW